jgi:hypothetical protein
MRKTLCACLIVGISAMSASAYAQQKKNSSVVTYYPAPRADYATILLNPGGEPAVSSGAGQVYYDLSKDKVRYYKNDTWADLGGSAASGPVNHIPVKEQGPASPEIGEAFYDNATDVIKFINTTGEWINMAADQYWSESALIPATASVPAHFNVYLTNATGRRVGIGTDQPAATLHVVYNDTNDPGQSSSRMTMFDKTYTDKNTDQYLSFYMYPQGTSVTPQYKNSSVMIYATGPDEDLRFATQDPAGSISFNVGGYTSPNSEIMRLTNPGGAGNPTPRVGIGNSTPPFALFIDSEMNCTSVLAVRQVATQQSANWYKGGFWNIIPYASTLYLAYGIYCKSADDWYCDLFRLPTGALNSGGAKIGIEAMSGIEMMQIGSWDPVTGSKSSWGNQYPLFDERGIWNGCSSRDLKDNFIPLDRDEVLQKIDQLEVTSWNYISEGPSARHIGPVAEDFYRLFKTGESDKILRPSDSAGVSLAGVKALSGKIISQEQQLLKLQAEIQEIRSKLGRKGGV